MLAIASVQRSTPTRGLYIMYNIMPLPLFLQYTGIKAFSRQKDRLELDWPGQGRGKRRCTAHRKFWKVLAAGWELEIGNDDDCFVRRGGKKYRVNTDSFSGARRHRAPAQFNIYTDGSKLEGHVGSGAAIFKGRDLGKEIAVRLAHTSTVFFAELEAIKQCAVIYIRDNFAQFENMRFVKLFVDSQAALQALHSDTFRSKQALVTSNVLDVVGEMVDSLTLVWTKAHVGTPGNERADSLAKQGSTLDTALTLTTLSSFLRGLIKEKAFEMWNAQWASYPHGRQSKQFFPCVRAAISKELTRLPRHNVGRLIRLTYVRP